MLQIELDRGRDWPSGEDWQSRGEQASAAALSVTPYAPLAEQPTMIEISIKLSDNDEVRQLNADYRDKDRPTNVLSFPQIDRALLTNLADHGGELLLGDVILAYQTCRSEADDKNILLADHVSHLIVHGILHLLGYDHEQEDDATLMESLEVSALARLGIPNPYMETTINR